VQYQHHVPDNCHFQREDAAQGLPFPNEHFDVVHIRALAAGVSLLLGGLHRLMAGQIRDWEALLNETIRVTKPGGLIVSVDKAGAFQLHQPAGDNFAEPASDFTKFCHYCNE
jgi:SAM-dependent methyltransferase